jgi:hypothetical protein
MKISVYILIRFPPMTEYSGICYALFVRNEAVWTLAQAVTGLGIAKAGGASLFRLVNFAMALMA